MMCFDSHYCHKNVQAIWLTNENVIWENLFLVSPSFGLARPYFHVKTSSALGRRRFVYNGAAAAEIVETKIRKMKITFFIVNEITWTFLWQYLGSKHIIYQNLEENQEIKNILMCMIFHKNFFQYVTAPRPLFLTPQKTHLFK